MKVSAKEWFTLVATIDRIQHDQEVLGGLTQCLILLLGKEGVLSKEGGQELEKALGELANLSERDQIANQPIKETEAELPDSLKEELKTLGILTEEEKYSETLETDFQSLMERAIFKLKEEKDSNGD